MDPLQAFLVSVVVLGYGSATSFIEERIGKFKEIDNSTIKQAINGVINLVIPYVVILSQPYWRPEFGSPDEVIRSAVILVVPLLVWLASQVAHYFDVRFIGKHS